MYNGDVEELIISESEHVYQLKFSGRYWHINKPFIDYLVIQFHLKQLRGQ